MISWRPRVLLRAALLLHQSLMRSTTCWLIIISRTRSSPKPSSSTCTTYVFVPTGSSSLYTSAALNQTSSKVILWQLTQKSELLPVHFKNSFLISFTPNTSVINRLIKIINVIYFSDSCLFFTGLGWKCLSGPIQYRLLVMKRINIWHSGTKTHLQEKIKTFESKCRILTILSILHFLLLYTSALLQFIR